MTLSRVQVPAEPCASYAQNRSDFKGSLRYRRVDADDASGLEAEGEWWICGPPEGTPSGVKF